MEFVVVLGALTKFRTATINFFMSLSPRNNSAPAVRIFMKFDIKRFFFRKYVEAIQV